MIEHELGLAMKDHFGSFGEVCFRLAAYRKSSAGATDREIEAAFTAITGRHRNCFNKKAFVLSCREPN